MAEDSNGLNQMNLSVVDLRFGPEQESILPPLNNINNNWTFLNLRANRLLITSISDFETRAFHDWQRQNGADLAAAVEEKFPVLVAYGMATVPAIANGLDNNSPADIWYNWNLMVNEPETKSLLIKTPANGPDTYYFRTRNDTWGLLQITGFSDKPRGVKIRYKLVQHAPALNSATALPAFTLRWCAPLFEPDAVYFPFATHVQTNLQAKLGVSKTWLLEPAMIDTVAWTEWGAENKKLFLTLKDKAAVLSLQKATSQTPARSVAVVWQDEVIGLFNLSKPLGNGLEIPLVISDQEATALEHGLKSLIANPKANTVTTIAPVEPPKLQFLAWQDAWKTNQPGAARHADGSPVTEAAELQWLKAVCPGGMDVSRQKLNPEPRFLHLWFSHPDFRQWGFYDVTLFDAAGNSIKLGADGSTSSGAQDASDANGNLGWNYWALSPGRAPISRRT